jgi:hypothetical protein
MDPNLPIDAEVSRDAQDLGAGQTVTVMARWILIAVGLLITLWSPPASTLVEMKISLFVLLGLAVANFFLHAQLLMARPIRPPLLYAASAIDLGAIAALTLLLGGLRAPVFVFAYPAVLALALVFPLYYTAAFTALFLGAYAVVTAPRTDADLQELVARAIALVGVAMVAAIYQRVEQGRSGAMPVGARAQTIHTTNRMAPISAELSTVGGSYVVDD